MLFLVEFWVFFTYRRFQSFIGAKLCKYSPSLWIIFLSTQQCCLKSRHLKSVEVYFKKIFDYNYALKLDLKQFFFLPNSKFTLLNLLTWSYLENYLGGASIGQSVKRWMLILARVMISGSRDWAPRQAPWSVRSLLGIFSRPLPLPPLSLFLSLSKKSNLKKR